jgi:iron complex transport system permease protein
VNALLSPDRVTSLEADRALVRISRTSGRPRAVLASLVLAALGFLAFCLLVSGGDFATPLGEVPAALGGWASPEADFIVHELRLPHELTVVLVGIGVSALLGALTSYLLTRADGTPHVLPIGRHHQPDEVAV